MKNRYIRYSVYDYYPCQTELVYDDDPNLTPVECTKDPNMYQVEDYITDNMQYEAMSIMIRINTKEELIKALNMLMDRETIFEDVDYSINDFIQLLKDNNLGDIFFNRFVNSSDWLMNNPLYRGILTSHDHFLLSPDNRNFLPFTLEHTEFKESVMKHKHDQHYSYVWHDVVVDNKNIKQEQPVKSDKELLFDSFNETLTKLEDEIKQLKIQLNELLE